MVRPGECLRRRVRGSPLPEQVGKPSLILAGAFSRNALSCSSIQPRASPELSPCVLRSDPPADCVYFEPAFPLLVDTLVALLQDGARCLFCYKRRRKVRSRHDLTAELSGRQALLRSAPQATPDDRGPRRPGSTSLLSRGHFNVHRHRRPPSNDQPCTRAITPTTASDPSNGRRLSRTML